MSPMKNLVQCKSVMLIKLSYKFEISAISLKQCTLKTDLSVSTMRRRLKRYVLREGPDAPFNNFNPEYELAAGSELRNTVPIFCLGLTHRPIGGIGAVHLQLNTKESMKERIAAPRPLHIQISGFRPFCERLPSRSSRQR
jgi:hypothetical protein